MMSSAAARQQLGNTQIGSDISINGSTYRRVNHSKFLRVNETAQTKEQKGGLLDGGADGGVGNPDEIRILEIDENNVVNVIGVTKDQMKNLQVGQGVSLLTTTNGKKIIGIFPF